MKAVANRSASLLEIRSLPSAKWFVESKFLGGAKKTLDKKKPLGKATSLPSVKWFVGSNFLAVQKNT